VPGDATRRANGRFNLRDVIRTQADMHLPLESNFHYIVQYLQPCSCPHVPSYAFGAPRPTSTSRSTIAPFSVRLYVSIVSPKSETS
jgi:hypothetical protein